jgi:type IX secretion system PorP/SprF family membrane protein
MQKIYAFLVAMFGLFVAYGQQPAQYSLYMLNPYGQNAGAAGSSEQLEFVGGFRAQWLGIEGAPRTQFVNFSLPIAIVSSGAGLILEADQIGARTGVTAKLSYNYKLRLSEDSHLALGASGGVVQGSLNGAKLRTPDGDYNQGVIDHADNILNAVSTNGTTPTFDVGLYYKNLWIEGGVSVNNITEPQLRLKGERSLAVSLKRNYQGFATARFEVGNKLSLHPSMSLRSDLFQTQIDFSTHVRWNENIFLGASFRGYSVKSQDALVILAGFKPNERILLGYSFDFSLSELKTVSSGSHELVLRYNLGKEFGKGKLPPVIYIPRF